MKDRKFFAPADRPAEDAALAGKSMQERPAGDAPEEKGKRRFGRLERIAAFVGGLLIFLGLLTAAVLLIAFPADLETAAGGRWETDRFAVPSENLREIRVTGGDADVRFTLSENNASYVVCPDRKDLYYEVTVKEGVLSISLIDERNWLKEMFSAGILGVLGKPEKKEIVISMPRGVWGKWIKDGYGNVSAKTEGGNISIGREFHAGSLTVETGSGDVLVDGVVHKDLTLSTGSGDVTVMKTVVQSAKISTGSGRILMELSKNCGDVDLRTKRGEIRLMGGIANRAVISTDSGTVVLEDTVVSTDCTINSGSGDVALYAFDAREDLTVTTVDGDVTGDLLRPDKKYVTKTERGMVKVPTYFANGNSPQCSVTTVSGDIDLRTGG